MLNKCSMINFKFEVVLVKSESLFSSAENYQIFLFALLKTVFSTILLLNDKSKCLNLFFMEGNMNDWSIIYDIIAFILLSKFSSAMTKLSNRLMSLFDCVFNFTQTITSNVKTCKLY